LAFNLVSIDIHIGELVVGPEDLEFVVRRQERPGIPQPDILDRPRIIVDLLSSERL